MSEFPEHPTEQMEFGIYSEDVSDFLPRYYPERFNITTKKEFERTAANCEGERVSISDLKNSELHVTGKVHASDMIALDEVAHSTEAVELITPVVVGGGMECYVKKTERGELFGWDQFASDYLFEYTMDLVSTGKDEYNTETQSRYVEKEEDSYDPTEQFAQELEEKKINTEELNNLVKQGYISANSNLPEELQPPDPMSADQYRKFVDENRFVNKFNPDAGLESDLLEEDSDGPFDL